MVRRLDEHGKDVWVHSDEAVEFVRGVNRRRLVIEEARLATQRYLVEGLRESVKLPEVPNLGYGQRFVNPETD